MHIFSLKSWDHMQTAYFCCLSTIQYLNFCLLFLFFLLLKVTLDHKFFETSSIICIRNMTYKLQNNIDNRHVSRRGETAIC
jgi:hypothetical protein